MRALANKRIPGAARARRGRGRARLCHDRVAAAPVPISLCAMAGSVTLPDGRRVADLGLRRSATARPATARGRTAAGRCSSVNVGDVVTISVTNALPAGHTRLVRAPGMTSRRSRTLRSAAQ